MKPIKCPNCGKQMVLYYVEQTFLHHWYVMRCEPCGVRGPIASGKTIAGTKRIAARLTREWIARMEARGLCVAGNNRINEVVDKFESPQPTEKHTTVRRARVGIPGKQPTTETYLEVTP